jgi:hypothetical protein
MANLLSTIVTGGSGTTPTLSLDRNIASPSNYYNGVQLEVKATSGTAGIGLHRSGFSHVGIYHNATNELRFDMNSGTVILNHNTGTIWGSGNLTNLNQLTNGPGYITSVGNITRLWAESHPDDYYVRANWTGSYWQLTSNHPSPVQVGYADSSGNSATTSQRGFDYLYTTSYLESAGAVYGTVFYDNNDRAYYVDPNSLSRIDRLQVVGGWGGATPNDGQINIRGSYPSITFRNTISNNMWLRHMDGDGEIQHYFAPSGVDATDWSIKHSMRKDGTFQSNGSMRAPIFYDSNDTTYYLDPNSTGTSLNVRGDIRNPSIWINDGDGVNDYNENIRLFNASNGVSVIAFGATGTGGTPATSILGFSSYFETRVGGTWEQRIYGGYVEARGSFRAPIFYDSENTAYYVDPNSNSKLVNLGLGGATPDIRLSVSGDAHIDGFLYQGGTAGTINSWGSRTYTSSGQWTNNANTVRFDNFGYGSTWSLTIDTSGNVQSSASMRAPIFYDSADTSYYGDFAGFSRMSEIGVTNHYVYNYDSVESGRAAEEFGVVGKYVATRNAAGNYPSFSFENVYGNHSWGTMARFHIRQSGADRPSIQFSSGSSNDRWNIGFCTGTDNSFRISQNMAYRPDGSGVSDGWGTARLIMNTSGVVDVPQGYISNGNPWGTANSAFFPNGITTAGGTNWIYGTTTFIGNAPGNGAGHDFSSSGHQYSTGSITTPLFLVNNHSDNTRGYRIHNTSSASVSAMFVNSSNQLVIAAGAVDQINLNKKVYVNAVALGVNVAPSATAGRIDASNDIVAYSSSDERLKDNITPIENALDKVKSLTGVEFDWKPEHKEAHGHEGHDTGIIAQQVLGVMPSAVRTNDTGYLAVRYEKLIGLLIEANKELAARVEELEKKIG